MQAPTQVDLIAVLPTLVLVAWGMGLLLVSLIVPRERKPAIVIWLGFLGFGAAFFVSVSRWDRPTQGFDGAVVLDNFAVFMNIIITIAGVLTLLLSRHYLRDRQIERSEYYSLLVFSSSGMTLMSSANDLTVLFIALELLSIPLYVLAGFARPAPESEEAALKYFLLGAFASAFLIYGIALVYGGSGTTAFSEILEGLASGSLTLTLAGVGMILAGLAFKVAAVPFHMWTPDVYQGAPTPITGFMSVGAKAAGFAALGRVFLLLLPSLSDDWMPPVAALAALTMIGGNVIALSQTDIKRMLAYSSIAHAGYLLMGVAAHSARGLAGMLFYLLAYTFTTLGAFAVLAVMVRPEGEDTTFLPYAGLGKRRPRVAAAMALFMFSLTGIPPTAGFAGKYLLFWATVEANLIWLAVLGVLTSLISAFFYLRVVITMYFDTSSSDGPVQVHLPLAAALGLTAAGTLVLGLWPDPLLDMARNSVWSALRQTITF